MNRSHRQRPRYGRFLGRLILIGLGVGWAWMSFGPRSRTWAVDGDVRTESAQVVDFGRDVRPILSDHCYACHGPDENARAQGIRLDTPEGLEEVINADDFNASEILVRIESKADTMPPPSFHKPLSDAQKKTLRDWVASGAVFQKHWAFVAPDRTQQIVRKSDPSGLLISCQEVAAIIDQRIDAGLVSVNLTPNELADRRTLIRRACLDLTGLPPSVDQIQRFLADTPDKAYENLLDRLLESRSYGEHMGRYWLDLVRYADTHGLHLDNYREMWAYRDWVIAAFNANMPFDEFMTKQLAGDLLPGATRDDLVASGFNRLNVTTNEGGSIYKEVFTRNVIDRTDAFGTIFLGLTTGCASCHDHKFDPISQRDYYSLFAFFNSLDGSAMDANAKDPPPVMALPTEEQSELLGDFEATLAELGEELEKPMESVDAAQLIWESSLAKSGTVVSRSQVLRPTEAVAQSAAKLEILDDFSVQVADGLADQDGVTIVAPLPERVQWQTLHLEALTDTLEQRVGVADNGNAVLSEVTLEVADADSAGQWTKVPITSAFADVEQKGDGFSVLKAIDGEVDSQSGWAVAGHLQPGPRNAWFTAPSLVANGQDAKVRIRLKYQSQFKQHGFRRVRLTLTDAPPVLPKSQQITLGPVHVAGPFPIENSASGYNPGRSFASFGKKFKPTQSFRFEDRRYRWHHRGDLSQVRECSVPSVRDRNSVLVIHQSIQAPRAQTLTLLLGVDDGFTAVLNGKEIATVRGPRELNPLSDELTLNLKEGQNDLYLKLINHAGDSRLTYAYRSVALGVPKDLFELINVPPADRTESTKRSLQKYYRTVYCQHPDWLPLRNLERGTRRSIEKLKKEFAQTLIWKETAKPRPAHVLRRGQYDQPGEPVVRDTPSFLPPFPEDAPQDRLGLAKWLLLPEHPLTSRVVVNRFWQQLFGNGLVRTSEDFGNQGEPASHRELLDFLAVYLQESGWDVKRVMKSMMMSRVYRRSAKVTGPVEKIDPENRWLARGPRFRLDAEVLRDQALYLSGQLVQHEGGPSVKPPQPDGLWKAVGYSGSNTSKFRADEGDKVYRRSVYMFWKRTSPPPQLATMDAPSRETCTARRERTNTPLQALLLMNETQFFEASFALAKRALQVPHAVTDDDRLRWIFEHVTGRIIDQEEQDELMGLLRDLTDHYSKNPKLATQLVGDANSRLAAWNILASTLMNLDEVNNK